MRPTLVIVDDETPLRVLLRKLITRDGRFDVVAEGGDGQEALDLVERHDPDLLLLDLGLPELDGLQVLERLNGSDRPQTVVLTGFDDPYTRQAVEELGAADCLVKGTDFQQILDCLSDLSPE